MSLHQTIQEQYQSMPDSTLHTLATDEMDKLTHEAQTLLLIELEKRGISISANQEENLSIQQHQMDISKLEKHVIQFVCEQKLKKESDAYIIGGLIERGFEEQVANDIILAFPSYLTKRKQNMSQKILTGTLQLVSGMAIIELPLNKQTQLAIIIIGYSLMIAGSFGIFHGWLNRKKINNMLN